MAWCRGSVQPRFCGGCAPQKRFFGGLTRRGGGGDASGQEQRWRLAGLTIQPILPRGYAAFARSHPLPAYVRQAAWALLVCRTAVLGGHIQACPEGHVARVWDHSCRHRRCPPCAWLQVERWRATPKARLLAGDHYQVMFTMPDERRELWRAHVRALTTLLGATGHATLVALLGDAQSLGARPGLIAARHTWRQPLVLPPHRHGRVTGGGLTAEGQGRAARNGFLRPVRVVMAVFRGKLLQAIDTAVHQGQLTRPAGMPPGPWDNLRNQLGRRQWNVYIRERYPYGEGVLTYLARYIRGGPLANQRLVACARGEGSFRSRRHGEGTGPAPRGVMTLPREAFIRRDLLHVPVPGTRVVRAYGV
jgi:Putative transposase/Transposase zinc-binding domain